ncbi:hypothetical protein [Umezawaea sp.]|uniref:hypothetical protein n=1 Tax=Umezawaea sp. TaxID=1955258 RepID=UPI002ED4CF87
MRCARVEVVLSFALGTLLVCGVVNAVVAVLWSTWWLGGVGGACLAAALAVGAQWLRHGGRRGARRALDAPSDQAGSAIGKVTTAA